MNLYKKLSAISLLLIFLSENMILAHADSNFLGMQKSRTAKILDNFNAQQQVILFENVPISGNEESSLFDSDSRISSLEQIVKRLEDTKEQMKEKKKNISKKKITLKNTIRQLDSDIEDTQKSITVMQQEIAMKNQKIIDITKKIEELDGKILENKKSILKYLSYIYSKGDLVYGDENNIDVIKSIVLNDGNLSDIINDINFKSLIELSGQNLIEAHRDLVKEFYYNKEEIKKDKIESLRLKSQLVTKNSELESQKAYKQNLLEVTKGQEALFNRYIATKQEKENDVRNRIDSLNTDYMEVFNNIGNKYDCNFNFSSGSISESQSISDSDTPKCKEIKNYFILEKKLRENNDIDMNGQNPLIWPSDPANGISTFFHDEYYFNQLGSEHPAIDVPLPQGTDLVAPAASYVYFISEPAPGKYGYIALKHAGGFVTVYGHISAISVKQFDFVQAGQVFAKSGGAPGTPGAGPMTSGAHLHFELYKDRANVDPLAYLDTTRLRFEDLPIKYRYKYIEDLKLKYGNRVNLDKYKKFYIVGDTEIDRQKYLLTKYATKDFNDWNIWVEEGMNGKIDPSFLICVGLAETGIGKNLKTAFNVGNIGNTDSGGTYDFSNAREGIYWMVKTFNNKYLSKYKTIDKLSRWGNKDGSIYASSEKNWHNNVTRCLGSLKGTFIEDDYKFRLSSINQ
ncbi:MAG: peptidoglycan DD-metalloendopeptidase family protein [Candidatus Gracilibacteria bacterium]|nr:peptidoglycan DD-metalloendopeptidase family protein [Candidatus Gracilibacteria bacterium]